MDNKRVDWKDYADTFYDKAVSLAVLFILFAFIVSPKMELKPYERTITITETIEIPPEIKEKIKPPEDTIKPVVEIVIDDELESDDDEEIEIISTIEKTTLDPYEEITENILGKTGSRRRYFLSR